MYYFFYNINSKEFCIYHVNLSFQGLMAIRAFNMEHVLSQEFGSHQIRTNNILIYTIFNLQSVMKILGFLFFNLVITRIYCFK